MKANLQKIFCQATLHYPCSSHHCITTNNGIAFLSNYPANLSAPSPQLFNLVRFGHKCFSSSRSHHKNVQFWERLRDCADSSLFSTSGLLHLSPVRLHLFTALSTVAEEEMWTGIENLRCHTPESGKHPQRLFSAHPQKPWMLTSEGPSQSSVGTFIAP